MRILQIGVRVIPVLPNVGTGEQLDEPNATLTHYAKAEGLSSNTINVLYRDREGILWIGTGGGGLNRLAPQFISGYSTAHGLGGNITPSAFYDVFAPWELIAIPLAGIVVAVLAALLPGRWAARTNVIEVLHAE